MLVQIFLTDNACMISIRDGNWMWLSYSGLKFPDFVNAILTKIHPEIQCIRGSTFIRRISHDSFH